MNKKLSLQELNRPGLEEFKKKEKLPLVVVLDNVRSMHNVGAVFRSSDAFLVEEIMLCGFTPQPPHRDIRKVAIGATESVKWSYHQETLSAINDLKSKDYQIVSIEQTEESVDLNDFHFDPKLKYAVVLGNEVNGVGQEIVDESHHCLELAQYGTKHSINVSVCAGIVIWKACSELHPGGNF